MARYYPLTIGFVVSAKDCTLSVLQWQNRSIWLDLASLAKGIPLVRARISDVAVHRLTHDLSIANEDQEGTHGIVRDHLAYQVKGAAFVRDMLEADKDPPWRGMRHFRIIYLNGCLDVISAAPPKFKDLAA